ncbi:MAG: deoxyribonuclease IV [Pirellulaceae bacterium]
MPKFGSHMSIAGGYYKAVEAAAACHCDVVQLFTKNNNQWRAKPITDEDCRLFREALDKHGITDPLSHASYLINLGSPDDALRQKSIDAFAHELERAHLLGIPNVVVHPGAFTTSSEEEGIAAIIASLKSVIESTRKIETRILLENTAGQGSTLGRTFEQLAQMLDGVAKYSERVGVCIDTCHAFAAGYDISNEAGFKAMIKSMNATFGIERIHAIHLNDSKKPLGSRVDRHEHIGDGAIGLDGFRFVVNHAKLKKIPMYLETEKGTDDNGRVGTRSILNACEIW